MPCRICQQALPPDANFCPACGARATGAATGPTQRLSPALPQVCLKCGGAMEVGFIPDEFRDHNEVTVWVRGEPERDRDGTVMLEGSSMWRVVTYCCANCGYLESYATMPLR